MMGIIQNQANSRPGGFLHRESLYSIWTLAVVLLLFFGAALVWTTYDEYEEVVTQEFRLLETHARFANAEIAGALRGIDLLLREVIEERVHPPEQAQQRQRDLLQQFPEVRLLITTDSHGRVASAESLRDPKGAAEVRNFDARHREYFTAHRDAETSNDRGYFLSRPFKTINQRNTITVSRAVRGKEGQLQGVVLVSMSPSYFGDVLRQTLPDEASSSATLFNRYGDVIYRLPGGEAFIGKNIADRPGFQKSLQADQRLTRHIGIDMLDGLKRMVVISKVGDTPLSVAVTARLDIVLDGWRHNLMQRAAGFTLIAALTLAFAWASHRRREERLRVQADLRIAATAFESKDAMMVTDANGVVLRVNRAFATLTGYQPGEIVGQTPRVLRSGRQDHAFYRAMWNTLLRTGGWQGEIWERRKNGDVYPVWLTISAVQDDRRQATHYVATQYDLSERKRTDEQINALAFFDQLTGLPNRTLLIDRLRQAQAASARSGNCGALLFVDLDDFKAFNDTQGYANGDLLIKQVGERVRQCIRAGDSAARLSGDDFAVVLTELGANESEVANIAETLIDRIRVAVNRTYHVGGTAYHTTASIGATLFKGQSVATDDLLKQADLALYRSKAAGRNVISFFDPAMEAAAKKRVELKDELRQAIEGNQLLLHYQPQVDAAGYITGAEALVRWQHPKRGLILPAEFIPLAEETNLILPLGEWVLKKACAQLADWAMQPEMRGLTIAVNVSVHQIRQRSFVEHVLSIVAQSGAIPARLKLELTESALVENVDEIIEIMVMLKAQGIQFSLDDFGTGYSSLTYLKRLPFDQLKIDRSFVRDVLTDANDSAIARTIIALAQSLGLSTVAEGVETHAQRIFFSDLGCHAFQGFLYCRPAPQEEFQELVASRQPLLPR